MVIIEVHDQLVAWPDEFALMMMEHYRSRGIQCVVHNEYPLVSATGDDRRPVRGLEHRR